MTSSRHEELREAESQKDSSFMSPLTSPMFYICMRTAWQVAAEETLKFLSISVLSSSKVAAWINEKNSIAQDDSWRDPSNLQTKLQKHQTFQAEIMANRNRLDSIRSVREAGLLATLGS